MTAKESAFQFRNPVIENLCYERNIDFGSLEEAVTVPMNITTEVAKSDNCEARVSVKLIIGNNDCPFDAIITMSADFRWDPSLEDIVDDLLNVNAPSLLVSYMRPIVATLTNASGYPPFNIPYLDMRENAAEK